MYQLLTSVNPNKVAESIGQSVWGMRAISKARVGRRACIGECGLWLDQFGVHVVRYYSYVLVDCESRFHYYFTDWSGKYLNILTYTKNNIISIGDKLTPLEEEKVITWH